jgi:hypothetical protein
LERRLDGCGDVPTEQYAADDLSDVGGTGAGMVTPGPVEETAPAGLMETSAYSTFYDTRRAVSAWSGWAVDDHVESHSLSRHQDGSALTAIASEAMPHGSDVLSPRSN